MSVKNKVPEIRFKGFSGEWIEHKLQDLTENGFSNGVFNDPQKVGKGYRLINVKDMYSGDCIDVDGLSLVDIDEKEFKNNKVQYGDIFFTRSSLVKEGIAYSNVNLSDRSDLTFDGHLIRMQPCKATTDPVFLASLFKTSSARKQLILGGKTTTMTTIGQSDIAIVELALPSKQEQTAIGNYFQKLDNLINQHQQKHGKLSNIKKAMLEKMFPKQGETAPEIRFKGFSGDWEEIELSDEVTFINGRAYSQEELLDKGKYTVLRVGNFYTNSSWYYSDLELGDKYYADNGDLLYTWSASFGPHIWNGDKVIYHYHIWKLELSENIDKLFLLHLLDYDRAKILSGSNGSTMIHITKSAMEAKKVFIPKKDEQIVIGNYFQKLDALIKQHQQQIIKLNNIKQACLSKMFV